MTTLMTKLTSAMATGVLFLSAGVMAGLGFAVIATLAVFAFSAVGLALIAAPFANLAQRAVSDTEPTA